MRNIFVQLILISAILYSCNRGNKTIEPNAGYYHEKFRPQFHFSPEKMWTNDPNGLVYLDGEYHLFYQYYPDSAVWGPMHWGHAVSRDLLHWKHLPVALYPDSLGYIFSGSAVIDSANTSGLGEPGKPAMIAIFTYHDPLLEKKGDVNYQSQGMAYSVDKGRTWTKYRNNPVLPNPGLRDFRDPSVEWNSAAGKWIMTMAAGDHVRFYSSENLKTWKLESEFGKGIGAHGGVWECPSLFEIPVSDEPGIKKWVLLVSINPGGPNGGSATQYFTGKFDGHSFKNDDDIIRWIDCGPDNYAGILWSNTGDRRIFLGWMNNWNYADKVPTTPWRGQMTIPRELSLVKNSGSYTLADYPVRELEDITAKVIEKDNFIAGEKGFALDLPDSLAGSFRLDLAAKAGDFDQITIEVSDEKGEKASFRFNMTEQKLFADRRSSGMVNFSKVFANKIFDAKAKVAENETSLTLLIDNCSAEFFLGNGLCSMTELVFPDTKYNKVKIIASGETNIRYLRISSVKRIW
jgi:fructan beta-fructosidase